MKHITRHAFWLAMLAPGVLLLGVFIAFPLIQAFNLSLYKWNGLEAPKFLGLRNFVDLFTDRYFWGAAQHTIVFAAVSTIGTVTIGLMLALSISRRVWGHKVYRVLFYMSVLLPMTVTGALWVRILEANFGLLNTGLRLLGLSGLALPWLASVDYSLGTIIAVTIWQFAGFPMIVLLAAIEAIPDEIQEAATLDGANEYTRLVNITIPMISPVLLSITMVQLIFSFKVFDIVWVMSRGGPAESSSVLGTFLYKEAFGQQRFGYASAISISMFSIIFFITVMYQRYVGLRAENGVRK